MPDGSQAPKALCSRLGDWVKEWTVQYNQIENRLQGNESFMNYGVEELAEARCPILYHALAPNPEQGMCMSCR